MKKYSTKKALIASVLMLAMCFSMLIGTTFAWFTDSVTSANNIIQTGSLKVGMYWAEADENPETFDGWQDAKSGPIFNSTLWEPGRVEAKHLKITNEGTLALKYQMRIVANGEVSDLADVIDVYYFYNVDNEQDLTGAVQLDRASFTTATKLGTLAEVLDASNAKNIFKTVSGSLESREVTTMTIALKMQESAGNEYQNKSIGTDFSIQLFATQYTSESDSFDNQYDANANYVSLADGAVVRLEEDGRTVLTNVENVDVTDSVYNVPVGVTGLSEHLFTQNSQIKTVVIPETVVDFGATDVSDKGASGGAFRKTDVETVVLPEGMTEIPAAAFNQATKLTSVNIPSTVESIGVHAFRATGLTELVIPASVKNIDFGAFRGMPNLTTVVFEGDIDVPEYAFRECAKLSTVYFKGENVTIHKNLAFVNVINGELGITFYVQNATVEATIKSLYGQNTKVVVPTTHTVTTQDGSQSLDVTITEQAYGSIVYHSELRDHVAGNFKDKIGSITVYTEADLKAAYDLWKAGMFVNNGVNDVNNILKFGADIDFAGQNFYGFGSNLTIEGNGHTLSNINFVSPNARQAGLIAVGGNNIINNLTIANATVSGAQAGIFGGNVDNSKLVNCALAGDITVNWVECAGESYNAVGAVWGCTSSIRPTTLYGNAVDVDLSNANITVNKDGIYYPAGFSGDGNDIVGEAYNGSTYQFVIDGATYSVVAIDDITEFNSALTAATTNTYISLAADIDGDVAFTQKANISLVIDGNNKTMKNGSFNITARAGKDNSATMTIKNFNFTTTDSERTFIISNETNYYPNNITISNCEFEGTGANSNVVAVNMKSSNKLVIEDCKANNVHSLLQNTSGWNLTVKNCEVTNAGRGLALGTVQGVTLEKVTVDCAKYGIRIDAGYNNNAVITDCNIKAFIPVVVRKTQSDSSITFNGTNTMTQTNADGLWCAVGNGEYETNGEMPTAATTKITVTLNDAGLDANGVYGATN